MKKSHIRKKGCGLLVISLENFKLVQDKIKTENRKYGSGNHE